MDFETAEVKASGGVIWRPAEDDGVELVVVHRPRYDDWSLPKGKLDAGESWEQAALREVDEEVGLACRLGQELPPVSYTDHKGRAKVVRYWLMQPQDARADFIPNDEVDVMRWVDPGTASRLLSYPHDVALVHAALERL
jgi:8-oxo-dGTP pyrophosphatase MutT (NUDIX family)